MVELKVDLINIVFPVGKITVKCQYAKKVSFILTKPQCEPESKEKVRNKIMKVIKTVQAKSTQASDFVEGVFFSGSNRFISQGNCRRLFWL